MEYFQKLLLFTNATPPPPLCNILEWNLGDLQDCLLIGYSCKGKPRISSVGVFCTVTPYCACRTLSKVSLVWRQWELFPEWVHNIQQRPMLWMQHLQCGNKAYSLTSLSQRPTYVSLQIRPANRCMLILQTETRLIIKMRSRKFNRQCRIVWVRFYPVSIVQGLLLAQKSSPPPPPHLHQICSGSLSG